jgi:membrane protein DedA with SNARE-associated domain
MKEQLEPPKRPHRAALLIVLILFSIAWLVITIPDPARIDGRSLTALAVVILLAAAGGIGFSWRRYFRRR